MNKVIFALSIIGSVSLINTNNGYSQLYKQAIGFHLDGADGAKIGPQYKRFFDENNALQAQVLFGDKYTAIGVEYSYNSAIAGAKGLNWYCGIGPELSFTKIYNETQTDFSIRPFIGFEYKIPSVPVAFHLDYHPKMIVTNDAHFYGGAFGFGAKFTF